MKTVSIGNSASRAFSAADKKSASIEVQLWASVAVCLQEDLPKSDFPSNSSLCPQDCRQSLQPTHLVKIAFIKQEVYQDLYVCRPTERDPAEILFSSQMRVGPIGLMAELGADFFIIKTEPDPETQVYRYVTPLISEHLHKLRNQTVDTIPGCEFFTPGSAHPNGEFAVDFRSVDWGNYDIVICINIPLPTKVILRYPHTLFAYMIGEVNILSKRKHFGYDVVLNQMARGRLGIRKGAIDFPYTFLKSKTLENLMRNSLKRDSKKRGVFMEINSTPERPVSRPPDHFLPLVQAGFEINLHQQKIRDNLVAIYDSKYFLKMGGRKIRGNSLAEAISLGVLCIMNRNDTTSFELIPEECHVENIIEAKERLIHLDKNPNEYDRLLEKQRSRVDELFFESPLRSLNKCLSRKRKRGKSDYPFYAKLLDRIWLAKKSTNSPALYGHHS